MVGPLDGLSLTYNDTTDDKLDSDATFDKNYPTINATTPGANEIDYTFDFGFTSWQTTDNSSTLISIDGTGQNISALVESAKKWRKRDKGRVCEKISNKKLNAKVNKSEGIYLLFWASIWNLPLSSSTLNIDGTLPPGCEVLDYSEEISEIKSYAKQLKKISNSLTKKPCYDKSKKIRRIKNRTKKLYNKIIKFLKNFDNQMVICPN